LPLFGAVLGHPPDDLPDGTDGVHWAKDGQISTTKYS
jgi:hypothetical protein